MSCLSRVLSVRCALVGEVVYSIIEFVCIDPIATSVSAGEIGSQEERQRPEAKCLANGPDVVRFFREHRLSTPANAFDAVV